MDPRTKIRKGMAVVSSDGVQLGRVIDVLTDAIVIEKGQLFLRDFGISIDDITLVRGDEIIIMRDHAAVEAERSSEQQRPQVPTPSATPFPVHHEPPLAERRAAGPGWDPLSVDEEQEEAPRTSGPDTEPPTRY